MRIAHFAKSLAGHFEGLHAMFFEKGDDGARGRLCILANSTFCNILGGLTGGAFYTGFLLGNDIDIANIGVITAIPFLASLLSVFSPFVLERFKKRKMVLTVTRLIYYFINIICLTVMPMFVHDKAQKIFWFGVIVFVSSAINFLFAPGYSVWHINFMPQNIRAQFFSFQQFFNTLIGGCTTVFASLAADALRGSPQQLVIITVMRYIGFAFAILDVIALHIPKEYPYEVTENPSLMSVFTIPLRNKKFLHATTFFCLHCAIWNFTGGVLNAYLLDSIGVSYMLINVINFVYAFFFIAFSKFWQKSIRRLGWLNTFCITNLIQAPTWVMYMFLTPFNATWLYTALRLLQHFIGIGHNLVVSNLAWLQMPKGNRTSYISFYNLTANIVILIAISLGTWVVSVMGDHTLSLGFMSFDSVQLLCGLSALCSVLLGVYVGRMSSKLEHNEDDV